jgi:SAM-dependent methyltransferase
MSSPSNQPSQPPDAEPATLDTDVVGWIKDAAPGFDNERHFRAIGDFSGIRLDPDHLKYFETYSRLYYYDRFIPGQGAEAILEQLSRFGTRGRWLDLGAGTTTLLWSIPLREISSIDCCDLVVEALAVLARFAESEDIPRCYADVLSAHGKTAEHLCAMRRKLRRFLVFDGLRPWPTVLAADRFDLITAFGVLSIAPDPEAYATALEEVAAHLAPGGRVIGADWVRKAAYIESDSHDNSYLERSQVVTAARQAGLRPLECCRQPIVEDPHYDAVLCWTLEKPGADGPGVPPCE